MARSRALGAVVALLTLTTALAGLALPAAGKEPPIGFRKSVCDFKPIPFDADHLDLTGTWRADDNGLYYLRQIGDTVWWNGMADIDGPADLLGRYWNNVAMGTLKDGTLTLKWADVPRGVGSAGDGEMVIKVQANGGGKLELRKVSGGENFGGKVWNPCTESGVGAKITLPQDGVYQAQITPSDLILAGAWPGDDNFLSGTATWTFDQGRFSLGAGQLKATDCGGTYKVVDGAVRLRFSSPRGCQGMDDVKFYPSDDGSTMDVRFIVCGPLGCNWRTDRALFERTWTRTADAPPQASPLPTIGVAADDGARIVAVETISDRARDLTVESPAVGTVKVRLLVPAAFDAQPDTQWPVLYLLHGCCDTPDSWMRQTDVEKLTAPTNLLVVTPDASDQGWYSDWLAADPEGPNGKQQWETFHLTELTQLLERNFRASDRRAIAGLSMGGYGAMVYAARNPGMFKAAASYSGVLALRLPGHEFNDPANAQRWGDLVTDASNWDAHDPLTLAPKLAGIPLYVSYGNGEPGPFDPAGSGTDNEGWIGGTNEPFVAQLKQAGIPVTVDAYGPGHHDWPYWQRALHASLPMMLQALGEPVPGSSAAPVQ